MFDSTEHEWKSQGKFHRFNSKIEISKLRSNVLLINKQLVFEQLSIGSPITKIELLDDGNNEFVVGFANGTLSIYKLSFAAEKKMKLTQSQKLTSKFDKSGSAAFIRELDTIGILRCHGSAIKDIQYSSFFKTLVTLSADGELKLWNRLNNMLIRSFGEVTKCNLFSISSQFGFIAVVDFENNLIIFDSNGTEVTRLVLSRALSEPFVTAIQFAESCTKNKSYKFDNNSPWMNFNSNQQLIALGYSDGTIELYQVKLLFSKSEWKVELLRDFKTGKISTNGKGKGITALKVMLGVDLDGNGEQVGRLEMVAGDSGKKLFIWH
ncbi:unnamed protein product [Ambrosiozyma monospora]|uniref:Unnamed protein product n=1 Tax=Ambrosiozyma monospora TaxID=43982 RepID=A0A9W6YZJ9_AMBMO|nr:unnamed protein product [Ambrosiozyma monospora]